MKRLRGPELNSPVAAGILRAAVALEQEQNADVMLRLRDSLCWMTEMVNALEQRGKQQQQQQLQSESACCGVLPAACRRDQRVADQLAVSQEGADGEAVHETQTQCMVGGRTCERHPLGECQCLYVWLFGGENYWPAFVHALVEVLLTAFGLLCTVLGASGTWLDVLGWLLYVSNFAGLVLYPNSAFLKTLARSPYAWYIAAVALTNVTNNIVHVKIITFTGIARIINNAITLLGLVSLDAWTWLRWHLPRVYRFLAFVLPLLDVVYIVFAVILPGFPAVQDSEIYTFTSGNSSYTLTSKDIASWAASQALALCGLWMIGSFRGVRSTYVLSRRIFVPDPFQAPTAPFHTGPIPGPAGSMSMKGSLEVSMVN